MPIALVLSSMIFASTAGLPYTSETIAGQSHRIYWTIDDHPCRRTPQMLRVLRRYRIKATFFVNAWGVLSYYIYRRYKPNQFYYRSLLAIYKDKHLIGNHTLDHAELCKAGVSRKRVRYELDMNHRVVKRALGISMKLFRPPSGTWCARLRRAVRQRRLQSVMWHIADYRTTATRMWRRLRYRVVRLKKSSTILLFHCQPKKLVRFLGLLGRKP